MAVDSKRHSFLCNNYNWLHVKHVLQGQSKDDLYPVEAEYNQTDTKVNTSLYHIQPTWECSGSVVECLTQDRETVGSSLTGVTALWSLSKTYLS